MKVRVGGEILAEGDQIPEKVGFVGLGIMGWPMACNLALAGYELVLYNRTRSKAEELAAEVGAKVAEIPKEESSPESHQTLGMNLEVTSPAIPRRPDEDGRVARCEPEK